MRFERKKMSDSTLAYMPLLKDEICHLVSRNRKYFVEIKCDVLLYKVHTLISLFRICD